MQELKTGAEVTVRWPGIPYYQNQCASPWKAAIREFIHKGRDHHSPSIWIVWRVNFPLLIKIRNEEFLSKSVNKSWYGKVYNINLSLPLQRLFLEDAGSSSSLSALITAKACLLQCQIKVSALSSTKISFSHKDSLSHT